MANKTKKVPSTAFVFQTKENAFTFAKPDDADDADTKGSLSKVDIVGYSGSVISDHWYWGELVIDLAGARFSKDKYPILLAHDTSSPLGFSGKPVVDTALRVLGGVLLDNDDATEFARNSEKGFPYEASVRVAPSRIEYIKEGVSVAVNGFTFDGPGHIFREWEYKEVSVCVFGWDSQSSAVAFGKDNTVEVNIHEEQEEQPMAFDPTKFAQEHPEDYKALEAHFTDGASSGAAPDAAFAQLQAEHAKTVKERDELATQFSASKTNETELSKRVTETEKQLLFMREQQLAASFAATISSKVAASTLPERLHSKFSKMFSMDAYLNADGSAVDADKLNTAFAAELKEWEEATASVAPVVIGGGTSFSKGDTASTTTQFSDEQYAALAKSMGVPELKV